MISLSAGMLIVWVLRGRKVRTMSAKQLTDAEVHELVIARQASLTREEWQERLDRVAKRFGTYVPPAESTILNGSHTKHAKRSVKSTANAVK
jgi:hypothetical protein